MFLLAAARGSLTLAGPAEPRGSSAARHGSVPSSSPELRRRSGSGKFLQVAPQPVRKDPSGARVILENSTVCHSRRISLLCPVDHAVALVVVWLMVSLTMILAIDVSFSCQGHLFFSASFFGGVGCCFSTESLILAQDERWRRA